MRIGLDATPLLGVRTGVGRYVEHLLAALVDVAAAARADGAGGAGLPGDTELVATAFTLRGAGRLPAAVPPGLTVRHRPVPARALRACWARAELPPVEWLTGRLDIFHGTNFVLPPLRRAAGVVTVHDLSYLRTPRTVQPASLRYRVLVPRSIRRAAVVCTPTAAVADEVRAEYQLPADRVVVAPGGVDPAWFDTEPPDAAWRAAHHLPERYLLFVGSLEPRKGLPALLAAYRMLRAEDAAAPPLVLAGPPGWGPALDTAGLPAGAVVSTGYLDPASMRRTVAGASCLAFPSVYEGFGLPPLEALACGVPAVVSDLPATREVLGPHARFVPVGDPVALAGALAETLAGGGGGPAQRSARRAHAARYSWPRCAIATADAYRRAASQ